MRVGFGYDAHMLEPGRPLILGGVEIPHHAGLCGHSDADVLSHAIADAILGAIGQPDIGHWFPPGDPACKDISSLKILEKAAELLADSDHTLVNIDSTLIAEAPRILPHREAMRANIAAALGLHPDRVNIKATTTEGCGMIGRGEGIGAMATVLLTRKRTQEDA